jgi:hypothetical protein
MFSVNRLDVAPHIYESREAAQCALQGQAYQKRYKLIVSIHGGKKNR